MIVSVLNTDGTVQGLHEDIAAVVADGSIIRLCRDGKQDEYVEDGFRVVVTG